MKALRGIVGAGAGAWMALAAPLLLGGCSQAAKVIAEVIEATESPTRYTLSASAIGCDTSPGAACDEIEITAMVSGSSKSSPQISSPVASDQNLLASSATEKQPDGSWKLRLQFNRDLPPGTYAGEIDVRPFVMDQLSQNPVAKLAYRLTVAPLAGQLAALKPLPPATAWSGFGGSSTHHAMIDVALDPTRFTRRWTVQSAPAGRFGMPAIARGLVHVARWQGASAQLVAFDETDGRVRWQSADFPGLGTLGAPAVDDGRLVVAAAPDRLLSFDAGTGIQQYGATGLSLPEEISIAPTLRGGVAYLGLKRELLAADAVTTVARWTGALGVAEGQSGLGWAPAIGSINGTGMAFVSADGQLRAHRLADGVEQARVSLPALSIPMPGPDHTVPVFVDANHLLTVNQHYGRLNLCGTFQPNSLSLVDPSSAQLRWSVSSCFVTNPVVGNDVVYVGNGYSNSVEARALADGKLLWALSLNDVGPRSPPGVALFGPNIVLTRNLLFVSSVHTTFAVDIGTRKVVWRHNMGGALAISDQGVLYIVEQDPNGSRTGPASLTAINLQ